MKEGIKNGMKDEMFNCWNGIQQFFQIIIAFTVNEELPHTAT